MEIKSNNFNVDRNGNMECNNAQFNGGKIQLNSSRQYNNFIIGDDYNYENDFTSMNGTSIEMYDKDGNNNIQLDFNTSTQNIRRAGMLSIFGNRYFATYGQDYMSLISGDQTPSEQTYIRSTGITTPSITQTSKVESKKNFEKLENALDIVKKTDIYKYNFKSEEDTSKKHIGFVIGDNYNYAEEITSKENDGADIYSLASVCLQAIKEQQEQIELLQEEINKLKGDK